jgi:signal transduction histidine kinase
MANTNHPDTESRASADANVQDLRQEVEHLRLTNQMLWALLADISKKMQVSSAAIKASVSSLLGYDIVLGTAAQHELLEVIENSTDHVSSNITLLTLVSQLEADTFTSDPEPIEISEILFVANEIITRSHPDLTPDLDIPSSENLACIDYDYLSIALVMLYELNIQTQKPPQSLNITAVEAEEHWILDIGKVSQVVFDAVVEVSAGGTDELLRGQGYLPPFRKLQLYVICKILERLSIQIGTILDSESGGTPGIRLMIPFAKMSDSNLYCE